MKAPALALLTVLSVLFTACVGTAAPTSTPTASPQQTVSIGVVSPSASHAPLLIALDKDYFGDAGLRVEYQTLANAELASAGLAAGHLDAAVTVPSVALFNEMNRGLDTRIVSSMGAYPAQVSPRRWSPARTWSMPAR
ncbi:MAG TPA: ABC transporter substrate-binding protein [Chloroflexota bacterium]|nr:ABC transporter substrate-binding protein [Chloroflexota bacterium]